MRKPRDYDAELKSLDEKARQLKARKVQQLGELVVACGADSLSPDHLAGALLGIDRAMYGRPSVAGRMRRALLPCRDAWAAARKREGDRCLAPWTSPNRKPAPRHPLDWLAAASEFFFR
jgi:hypothetical protein